jgi:AraC-like DNA-binding protein
MNLLDEFAEHMPEIIIMDSSVVIPYQTLLEQLEQSRWEYGVVLLSNDLSLTCVMPHVTVIQKDNLSKHELWAAMETAFSDMNLCSEDTEISLKWKSNSIKVPLYPTPYFILYANYVGDKINHQMGSNYQQLRKAFEQCGESILSLDSSGDVIYIIRKTDMRAGFSTDALRGICLRELGLDYAVFYKTNIRWSDFEYWFRLLTNLEAYGYFFRGMCTDTAFLEPANAALTGEEIEERFRDIVQSALDGDKRAMEEGISTLYLEKLKSCSDFFSRNNVRWYAEMLRLTLCLMIGIEYDVFPFEFRSVEAEHDAISAEICKLSNKLKNMQISKMVAYAVVEIFGGYTSVNLSLDQLAVSVKVNKTYLGRKFKEQLGITVVAFIQLLRMRRSCFLLSHTDNKILQVAKDVGYEDAAYFSRVFKKYIGISPELYRNEQRYKNRGKV